MLRNFNKTLRNKLWGVFILTLLLIFSLSLSQQNFKMVPGSNLEAWRA